MGIVYRDQGAGAIVVSENPIPTVCVGDSTVRGTSDTGLNYRVTWAGFIPRAYGLVTNRGFDGLTYADQAAGHATWEDIGGPGDRRILHLVSGINDLVTGRTAAQMATSLALCMTYAQPNFGYITLQTVTSASFWAANSAFHTQWVAWNAWLRANWQLYADYLVDIAADPTYGADSAYLNTDVFEDGVHLTPLHQRTAYDLFYGHANAAGRATLGQ